MPPHQRGPGLLRSRRRLPQHMQAGLFPRPQRLIARCQTAFATRPCQSAGAVGFDSSRAVNPGSSIGTIYRAGACGRISRANRLWSSPRHLPGMAYEICR